MVASVKVVVWEGVLRLLLLLLLLQFRALRAAAASLCVRGAGLLRDKQILRRMSVVRATLALRQRREPEQRGGEGSPAESVEIDAHFMGSSATFGQCQVLTRVARDRIDESGNRNSLVILYA